jgi:hypothetical protein
MRILMLVLLLLAGCATQGTQPDRQSAPAIERISAEELEKLMPKPTPALTMDEIVQLSTAGTSADDIIARIRQANAFFDLTPTQVIDLNRRGVSQRVLDYLHEANLQAIRNSMTDEINRRGDACRAQQDKLEQELMRRSRLYCDPYWGYPYSRLPPYRHYPGGLYWGW